MARLFHHRAKVDRKGRKAVEDPQAIYHHHSPQSNMHVLIRSSDFSPLRSSLLTRLYRPIGTCFFSASVIYLFRQSPQIVTIIGRLSGIKDHCGSCSWKTFVRKRPNPPPGRAIIEERRVRPRFGLCIGSLYPSTTTPRELPPRCQRSKSKGLSASASNNCYLGS